MNELPRDLASAPGPEVLPDVTDTTVAYTDFQRDESGETVARWPRGVSVTAARLDGYGRVELVELDGRGAIGGREFLAAVEAWERVADHDHVAPVVASGKRPRPWVATIGDPTLVGHGRRELATTLWIGVCLAGALAYAHGEQVVHGAVTPERVRLHPTPEWPFPRLDGVRLADVLGEADAVVRAAPEQVAPEPYHGTGTATDVYGLALTLYEALTGDLPYVTDGDPRAAILGTAPLPPSTVEPTLPTAVDEVLLPALAKDPADRPGMGDFRDDLVSLLATETPDGARENGSGTGDPATDSSFPFLDGDRADWRTACPSCGRSVTNTLAAFRAHWHDAERCDGPPERPPVRASHSQEEWTRVVESVESVPPTPTGSSGKSSNHPLWTALAEERVVEVGGVSVARGDGTYPWLHYPRRGWRVPCPACGSTVFNAEAAMKAHWSDAPRCPGPPDDFETA